MMICCFYPSTVRHNDQSALVKPWLQEWLLNRLLYLLHSIPRRHGVSVHQRLHSLRAGRCIDQRIRRDAFTYPVPSHEASGLVGCTELKERQVLRVELASQRASVWEVREQLAALLPPLLLFQQCQQLQLFAALLRNQLKRQRHANAR